MEDRKRRSSPLGEGSDGHAAQKRKLSSLGSGALADAPSAEEESKASQLDAALGLTDGFLETFRKGALHRQMLEYKRDWERISTKAEQVEREWKDSLAKLSELEACWSTLVNELRGAVGTDQNDVDMANGHIEGSENQDSQLSQRVQEASHLIAMLSKKSFSGASPEYIQRQETLAKDLIQSQSAVRNLESLLKETKEELDKTVAALRLTQKQADRRRSESVRKLSKNADLELDTKEDKSKLSLKPASNAASTAPSPAAGSPGLASPVKHEVKEEQEQSELRDVLEGSSGLTRSEIEALQQEAESRQKQVDALNQENLSLRHQLGNAKIDSRSLSDEVIKETALYRRLLVDLEEYRTVAEAAQAIQKELREELLSLRGKETQHRQDLEQEYAKEATKLNKDLTRLQSDLVRVRHERDKGIAEIAELSSKDAEKCRHVEEMKTLAHSRQMRINTLVSEIYRLRMVLAAEHGDAELLQTYSETWKRLQSEMNGDLVTAKEGDSMSIDQSPLPEEALVKSLQSRVKELEALAVTYREQLQTLSGAADEDLDMAEQLVRGEAQAKADLEEAQAKITKLEGMLGDSGAPDVATLAKRTTDAEKMVTTLEAKVRAHDLSTNMLIAEVSKLSETWEQLNKQNQSKVFELAQYDVRLERMATEKAKANQKYFASEREKEALTNQSNVYQRLSTQQKGAINLLENEKHALLNKLTNAEKELQEHQTAQNLFDKKISELVKTAEEHKAKAVTSEKQLEEAKNQLKERTTQHYSEEGQRKKAEEQLNKLEKEVEKWKGKANQATAAANGQGRYVETDVKGMAEENTLLKRMLKCSSCRQKFKSHTITRCFHMFCKDCIDSRLETRQRKCPSCSAAFGAHDVQQVYF